jgi:hypothetical protein
MAAVVMAVAPANGLQKDLRLIAITNPIDRFSQADRSSL